MRFDSGPDRPLYLVDSDGKIKQVELPTPEGGNSNPIMQSSRNTIIYANSGVLRVMAADGSGDRKLFNRDPAGCDNVAFARNVMRWLSMGSHDNNGGHHGQR